MLALHDITDTDMEAIMNTRVSVVGAGGLGSPALRLLAAIGFGRIRIVDRDVVELSNIQRQTIYNTGDIGLPKADAAVSNLARMNPEVEFEPISAELDRGNAVTLLHGSDIIIDGLDTFEARRAVNAASLGLRIPYIYAGAIEYYANLSTFIPGITGCLECMLGDIRDNPARTCADIGVSPTLLSIAASIQVREAVLLATGKGARLAGRLMHIDINRLSFEAFDIGRVDSCPACSGQSQRTEFHRDGVRVNALCSNSYGISPGSAELLDLGEIARRVTCGRVTRVSDRFIIVETDSGARITLMPRGNAIVKGVQSPAEALRLYNDVIGT